MKIYNHASDVCMHSGYTKHALRVHKMSSHTKGFFRSHKGVFPVYKILILTWLSQQTTRIKIRLISKHHKICRRAPIRMRQYQHTLMDVIKDILNPTVEKLHSYSSSPLMFSYTNRFKRNWFWGTFLVINPRTIKFVFSCINCYVV